MQVTKTEEFGKQKVKIYIDDSFAFWLYRRDTANYQLKEGAVLEEAVYHEILETLVIKQAKQKAMNILERMDRTEQELFRKLLEAEFTQEVAEQAVAYVKQFRYIDDYRYAVTYIRIHSGTLSKRFLLEKLRLKGVDSQIAEQAYEEAKVEQFTDELQEDALELTALRRELAKRRKGRFELTAEERRKLAAALYRKGFSYDMIRRELDIMERETEV